MRIELLPEMDEGDWHFAQDPVSRRLFVREHGSKVWRLLVGRDVAVEDGREVTFAVQTAPIRSLTA